MSAGLGAVRSVVNMAGPRPNPASETDGGQSDDREYSSVTEVIYFGDVKTWQFQAGTLKT